MITVSQLISRRKFNLICLAATGLGLAIALNSCTTNESGAGQYEATARATYTWRVNYTNDPLENKRGRYEEFKSASIVNINGEKPEGAVYQDDNTGIWWPKLPPKPSVDEIEARRKSPAEKIGKLELGQKVEYRVKFNKDGERLNLPTNRAVYRQVAKNYPDTPISFTLGVNNGSVTKATPVVN